jgi:hypothetical protein
MKLTGTSRILLIRIFARSICPLIPGGIQQGHIAKLECQLEPEGCKFVTFHFAIAALSEKYVDIVFLECNLITGEKSGIK